MSRKMLINASHPEENRVAIVVDGLLSELDIELAGQEQARGNIYKAVVVRVETGLQAAFVDYGAEKLGFLQISEIHPELFPARESTKGRPRIADLLRRGQEILVQVVKEERGNKGAALTTFLSLPGRYMVLMPDSTTKGVSRKITEEAQRKLLKKTMAELNLPERMGYIVRTAGIGKDKEELKRDFDYLVRLFEGIIQRRDQVKAPAQLYQESNLAIRSIRDYFSTDMDEVLVDDEKVFQDTKDFFSLVMPELSHLVKRHRERRPIFSRYQIEEQIDGLSKNQVPLPSGGSIVIDPTEALVAIDVNSGKMSSESGIEATALKTNLEAASEVGRQLRLRDLGGLIVIDFIDMRDRKHIREIEQELRRALKNDKARVSVGRISQFGLLEMSRQRIKPVLSVGAYQECPHCHGVGRIKSIESQAVSFLRQAHTAAAKGQVGHIEARVPYDVANFLLNQKRATINQLEILLGLKVSIFGQAGLLPGELHLETFKREKEQEESRKSLPVSHANQIEMALAEARQEALQPADPDAVAEDLREASDSEAAPDEAGQETGQETGQEAGQETGHEASPANAEDAPTKKRRRRRRKKPATSSDAAPPAGEPEAAVADQAEAETALTTDAAPAKSDDQAGAETPGKTPKRRSRRTRKPAAKTAGNGPAPEAPAEQEPDTSNMPQTPPGGDTPQANSTISDAPPAQTETATAPGAPAPAKRRPRRPRKPAAKPAAEQDAATTGTAEATADSPVEADKQQSRRSPKAPATTADQAAAATPDSPPAAPSETPAPPAGDTPAAPKTRARRPRKATTPAATAEPAAAAETPAAAGAETTAKPARKRRTRSAPKTEETGQVVDTPAD
ncbi:MAG: Rne/Rng family ribonuclease [Pelovirga sp.]